jgi:hypothetical protein
VNDRLVRVPLDPPPQIGADPAPAEQVSTLPAGDPARLAFLVQRTFASADAFNRRDNDALLGFYDAELEVVTGQREEGGAWAADFDSSYSGHGGLLEALGQWLDAWEDLRLEPAELIDEGGDSYVLFATWFGRGAGSGIELTTGYQARHVLSGGRISRIEFWAEPEQALRDLGLTP